MTDIFFGILTLGSGPPQFGNLAPANLSAGIASGTSIAFDVVDPDLFGIALAGTTVTVTRGFVPDPAIIAGVAQPGWSFGTTAIAGGYRYTLVPALPFAAGQVESVAASAIDLDGDPGANAWSFTIDAGVAARRLPYMTAEAPADGATLVAVGTTIAFQFRTDVLAASSIALPSVNVQVNGVPVIVAGVNVAPGLYGAVLTPGLRFLDVVLTPVAVLAVDTVYRVDGQADDNLGAHGVDTFAFSTGAVDFAVQIDRSEPVECPVDAIPVPLLDRPAATTQAFVDTVADGSFDWVAHGTQPYDEVELQGPDAGRWIVRTPGVGSARLYRVAGATGPAPARVYRRREFADRNPVGLVFSPLFRYRVMQVSGDTADRYWAGWPSDSRFPLAFHDAPVAVMHDRVGPVPADSRGGFFDDQTGKRLDFQLVAQPVPDAGHWDRYSVQLFARLRPLLTGTVALVNGSGAIVGTGTNLIGELGPGAKTTFGSDPTVYTVVAATSTTAATITPVWAGSNLAGQAVHRRLAGTRVLQQVRVDVWPLGTTITMGLTGQTGSPVADGLNRLYTTLAARADGRVEIRTHVGAVIETRATDMTVAEFVGRDWLVELELLDETTAVTRLASADEPGTQLAEFTCLAVGTAVPDLAAWTVVGLGGTADNNIKAVGSLQYADVEPGQGQPYVLAGTVDAFEAKARPTRNVQWIPLDGAAGPRSLTVRAALAAAFTAPQSDTVFWDVRPTLVVIDQVVVQGGQQVVLPVLGPEPKFSLRAGFNRIDLTFRADRRGRWYVLADGRDVRTARVLAAGPYEPAGVQQAVEIQGGQLGDLADGPHDIAVVVCRDPLVLGQAVLTGRAGLTVTAIRQQAGQAALTARADLTVMPIVV